MSTPEHVELEYLLYGNIRLGGRWVIKDTRVAHRADGPSSIDEDGTEWWYQYGHLHRTDGPAIAYPGDSYYHIKGQRIHSAEEFQRLTGMSDEDITFMILKYGHFK